MADPDIIKRSAQTGTESYYDLYKQLKAHTIHRDSEKIMFDRITEVKKNPGGGTLAIDGTMGTDAETFLGLTMAAARHQGTEIEDTMTRLMLVEAGLGSFEEIRAKLGPKDYARLRDVMLEKALTGQDAYGQFSLEPNNIAQLIVLQGLNASPQKRTQYKQVLEKIVGGLVDSNGQPVSFDRITTHDLHETIGGLLGYREDGVNQPYKMTIGRTRANLKDWDKLPTVTIPQGQAMAIAALAIGIQAPTEAQLQQMEDLPLDNAVNTPNGKIISLSQAIADSPVPLK